MALSKVFTPGDRTNFARLALIIVEELTPILRDVLEKEISPSVIFNRVKANTPLFKNIRKDQLLIIQNAHTDGYRDFDITLLYTLIRNLCSKIPSPTQGWGITNMPSIGETSLGDDIERIRLIRNGLYSHVSNTCVSQTEFNEYWAVMYGLCKRTGKHLHKNYIKSLQIAQYRPLNEELEREWMEKIKKSSESEKEILEVVRELTASMRSEKGLFSASAKVNAEAKDPAKKEQADFLLETTIDLLNHMVDCINEVTTEDELKEIFDTVETLLKEDSKEIKRDSIKSFFNKLSSKIKTYAHKQVRKISILAKFTKFVIFLRKKYGADIKSYQSSLLLHLKFRSKEGYELYEKDLEKGEIGKEILDLLLYPVYLACFDLNAHDLIISLNNKTIYNDAEKTFQGLRIPESVERKFPPTDIRPQMMDPRTSGQDVMRCDLCGTAVVQLHCDTCLVNLCKACVGEHMASDESKYHKVVKFHYRKTTPLYPECTYHKKKRCEMYCIQCCTPVCSTCRTYHHLGHSFSNILEILEEQKRKH